MSTTKLILALWIFPPWGWYMVARDSRRHLWFPWLLWIYATWVNLIFAYYVFLVYPYSQKFSSATSIFPIPTSVALLLLLFTIAQLITGAILFRRQVPGVGLSKIVITFCIIFLVIDTIFGIYGMSLALGQLSTLVTARYLTLIP